MISSCSSCPSWFGKGWNECQLILGQPLIPQETLTDEKLWGDTRPESVFKSGGRRQTILDKVENFHLARVLFVGFRCHSTQPTVQPAFFGNERFKPTKV